MRFPGFKLPKHQQFKYQPRYWDPKEEERKERQARVDMLQEGGVDAMKARISSTFQRNSGSRGGGGDRIGFRSRQVAKSNITLVVVIAVLLLLSYLAIVVYLPRLEEMM